MTTPAGWYDDGSGRLRWWDGQQWTEHFAPEAPAAAESEAAADVQTPAGEAAPGDDSVRFSEQQTHVIAEEPPVEAHETPAADGASAAEATPEHADAGQADHSVLEDTVTPADAAPDASRDWSAPASNSDAGGSVSPEYAPPAPNEAVAPTYGEAAAPTYGGYPGAAPAYAAAPGGYPGNGGAGAYAPGAPYPGAEPEGPKKLSVLGLVGLGLSVVGTILVFIPVIGFIGFFFLAAGFIVSIISLFLKGKKWPGIAGLALSVVGTVLGIIMSFVYLFAFAQGLSEEVDDFPTSSPSISAEPSDPDATEGTDGSTGTGRPTAEEVAVGITEIVALAGNGETFTEEQIGCFADEFVASDIDDETLRIIASGEDATFTDPDAATAFTEEFSDAITVCLVP
ncbi:MULTISPECIES: DUF2510 domain-containing protein [unclassified Microbacterium]|uniref:DUF2510 domain-containing protein n=1 Tax=unclassified Microbacterium TaxID=2609290 RepID=UPI000EA8BF43|nr:MULTISPECIES: DUF2510 domain-containing protein [unclassified Microbacterium]MBT2486714.1 DUF2510 domain-containing protein [Microbacterium sp. ISL-108]RKN64650.1 DUF2510 domain-containing protein [Microbacterium sp. CGR2]